MVRNLTRGRRDDAGALHDPARRLELNDTLSAKMPAADNGGTRKV